MGKREKRVTELENKMGEIQLQLNKLEKLEKVESETCQKEEFGRERKVLLRDLTDVKIRIRNLQRNIRKDVSQTTNEAAVEEVAGTPGGVAHVDDEDILAAVPDIVAVDELFNPNSVELNNKKPMLRLYPKLPLPHSSQPSVWDRVRRVGRRKDRPVVRRTDWEGQFTGVEEKEEKVRWKALMESERKWRKKYSIIKERLGLEGQKDDKDDSKAVTETPTHHEANAVLVVQPGEKQSISPDRLLLLTDPSSRQTPPQPPCICYRPLHLVTCSSTSCGHCFYGRVATHCPNHPTDHYLMDHPTICPICKADPLVEDTQSTMSNFTDNPFTKIKSEHQKLKHATPDHTQESTVTAKLVTRKKVVTADVEGEYTWESFGNRAREMRLVVSVSGGGREVKMI